MHGSIVVRLCLGLAAWSGLAVAENLSDQVQARLLTPIASYSRAGALFRAKVTGPVLLGGSQVERAGMLITGRVRSARSVRFGIRRERAEIELEFNGCQPPEGPAIPCDVELVAVDNARETVTPNNRIRGILAASHAYSWLNGLWIRPPHAFVQRSVGGLTGTVGIIQNHLAAAPASTGIIIASRLMLLRLPDPEIELPAGTDLILRVTSGIEPEKNQQALPAVTSPALIEWVRQLPSEITRPDGTPVQDLVNFAFAGSQEDVARAFEAAGWSRADPPSAKAFARTYGAFAEMKAYATLPVSPLMHGDRLPDLVFQKSLNSVSKRHHLRLWLRDFAGSPVWIGAATHDIATVFSGSRMRITHRIDPAIDKERTKVINDLTDAGCIANIGVVEREQLARNAAGKDDAVTDGALYFVELRVCRGEQFSKPHLPKMRRSLATRAIRRIVLETRHYILRGNAFYWGFRATRWGLRGLKGGK